MTFAYKEGFFYSDLENWTAKILRHEDQFYSLCYAFGIIPNNSAEYSNIDEQISFVLNNKTRTPLNVLEIGPGRGELACALSKMGVNVTAIDVAQGVQNWFNKTAKHYFGDSINVPVAIESNIKDIAINFTKFDTIVMCESIEHITEIDFTSTWENICRNFSGLFCITNGFCMHPLPIGSGWPDAEKIHCRVIDDNLYDDMSSKSKKVIHRDRSHLVLEF